MATTTEYHHGDLANALLRAVEEIVIEKSTAELSLREAARRAGVSHSAPAHHFGDKQGMLVAFAVEGFRELAAAMGEAASDPKRSYGTDEPMEAIGLAYIHFAVDHPAHFDVMFRSGLDKRSDPELHEAADAAYRFLEAGTEAMLEGHDLEVEAHHVAAYSWSVVHGLASLWVDGSLPQFMDGESIDEVARAVLAVPDVVAPLKGD